MVLNFLLLTLFHFSRSIWAQGPLTQKHGKTLSWPGIFLFSGLGCLSGLRAIAANLFMMGKLLLWLYESNRRPFVGNAIG